MLIAIPDPSPGSLRSPPSPTTRAFTPVLDGLWERESLRVDRPYTSILPSSVMASSTLSPESPSSISLWARPEGIIGKQFSF